ncbi:MAG: flagellar hook-length control protein FliK [Candidatus Hydrogenedentes bacterium]|nr:flagellar hook-length control protein FliK [Candidatus Hydrogenedentota bacterium]
MTSPQALVSVLRPGQQFQAVVEGSPGNLSIRIGGTRIPLSMDAVLELGQAVNVEVTAEGQGLQLRVTPQSQPQAGPQQAPGSGVTADSQATASGQPAAAAMLNAAAAQSGAPTPAGAVSEAPLAAIIMAALKALGLSEPAAAPESATQLIPQSLPPTEHVVRQVLSLVLTQATVGTDLEAIQAAVADAAAEGAVLAGTAERLNGLLARLLVSDESSLAQVVREWGRSAFAGLEARMASGLAAADAEGLIEQLSQDIRGLLARLREDDSLVRFLQASGRLRSFEGSVERVLERLSAAELQNARSLEHTYRFVEVPVMADSGFGRLQVHFFGGGKGREEGFDPRNAMVVLDLSTVALGDLWVRLAVVGGACTCSFRAAEDVTAEAIAAGAQDLREALAAAGYAGAQVHVTKWDGDRFRELVSLARQFGGLNVKA